MKNSFLTNGLVKLRHMSLMLATALTITSVVSCKDDDDDSTPAPSTPTGETFSYTTLNDGTIVIEGETQQNVSLDATKKYLLRSFVYVDSTATLTIPAGTVIKGEKSSKGSLIVRRGGKIFANGTAASPVIFTSEFNPGSRNAGDWGGVIICGSAPINVAGGLANVEGGPDANYGGSNPSDNSGSMTYVRIEYPGIAFQPNSEINGLTLAGVGSGTVIENIQVSYSGDDGFEMFGGTVNMKNIISYCTLDDDFDTDFGYRGNVQFAVALRDPNLADISGSNGFESDNDATGSSNSPQTMPLFSNVTIVGPMSSSTASGFNTNFKRAAHLRRNSACSIYNSVLMGYPVGLYIDGALSAGNATNNDLQFRNTLIAGIPDPNDTVVNGATLNFNSWFQSQGGVSIYAEPSDLNLSGAFNLASPDFMPGIGSPALSGANFTGRLTSPFFTPTTFVGAFGTTNWTASWSNWTPQNTAY